MKSIIWAVICGCIFILIFGCVDPRRKQMEGLINDHYEILDDIDSLERACQIESSKYCPYQNYSRLSDAEIEVQLLKLKKCDSIAAEYAAKIELLKIMDRSIGRKYQELEDLK
jgi:hypothetical protein